MPNNLVPITPNCFYHIYNRTNGKEQCFDKVGCERWLALMRDKLLAQATVYAYAILPNHYHMLLKVGEDAGAFSKAMSDIANAFARWYNLRNRRTGSLFQRPFKRQLANDEAYQIWLTWYIHRNPCHHGLTPDWESYPHSSYKTYMSSGATHLQKAYLLQLFGGAEGMQAHHRMQHDAFPAADME